MLANGAQIRINPEGSTQGQGGVSSTGQPTAPRDNAFYYGQADFVVRVNRMHSIWFDTLGDSMFSSPVIEPSSLQQPAGSQVVLAFRGATSMGGAAADYTNAATPGGTACDA